MPDSTDDSNSDLTSDKKLDMYGSMNPLKSSFGLDIGLPWPLNKIVLIIIFLVINFVRLVLYILIGTLVFSLTYGLSISIYCTGLYNSGIITCFNTQYLSQVVLLPAVIITVLSITLLAVLDYKIDLRKYY